MSSHPGRTRLAEVARLVRQAEAAEAAGRLRETATLLEEVARLDPGDRRTLHRLGDLYRIRLKQMREAARCYAAEARVEEREDFPARALALWRLVVRCDPARLEAHERIGALCVALGRLADARAHYHATARELEQAGLARDAAVLRAHLAALADFGTPRREAPATAASAGTLPAAPVLAAVLADESAADLAADRFQNGRLFHHYGLHQQARVQLEELLVSFPDHVEGRRLLVEVCRLLEDHDAAAEHMRTVTRLMRAQGVAGETAPVATGVTPTVELPVEEWAGLVEEPAVEEPLVEAPPVADPMAEILEAIRGDVERVVDRVGRKGGGQ